MINSQERLLYLKISQLQQCNYEQNILIHELKKRSEYLQGILNADPIQFIIKMLDPAPITSNKIDFQNILEKNMLKVIQLQRKAEELAIKLSDSQAQNILIKKNIAENTFNHQHYKKKIERLENHITKLNEQIKAMQTRCLISYKQKLQAVNQKIQLAKQLERVQRVHQNTLKFFGKQSLSKKSIEVDDSIEKKQSKNEFQILLELQRSQLQDSRMRVLHQAHQQLLGSRDLAKERDISYLKNTIRHLRSELNRYNSVTEYIMNILGAAQKVIARYSKAIQEVSNGHQPIIELTNKNQDLQMQIKIYRSEQVKLKEQLSVANRLNQDIKRSLELALEEKDYFYHLLFEIHQENCDDLLKAQKQAYLNRLKDRRQNNVWSSIAELIQINQSLKKRLQIT